MKQRKQSVGHIRRRQSFNRKNDQAASIVVEAAIVLPIIILLLIAFFVFIHISIVQMALQSVVQQAVMVTAAHYYPIDQLHKNNSNDVQTPVVKNGERQSNTDINENGELVADTSYLQQLAERWLPEPIRSLLTTLLPFNQQLATQALYNEAGKLVLQPLLVQFADNRWINATRLTLERLELPDLTDRQSQHITMLVVYEYPLKMPLLNEAILLKATASERAWLPDEVAANSLTSPTDSSSIRIVSIEPTPLAPGKKATVVVQTTPGTTVNLQVYYKSGRSKARNLGIATTDGSGNISFTWHVSGNTTPGLWKLVAEIVGEEATAAEKYFTVEKTTK
ncbi:hypothetical protein ACFSTH_15660 [Paenibacillus yanchengensis]|uniref:Pilus assembly protein n=1 Tax=Paenibacillus yanchengensis TaxID=2035833 RepID=A0ABW4YFK1_9BACL